MKRRRWFEMVVVLCSTLAGCATSTRNLPDLEEHLIVAKTPDWTSSIHSFDYDPATNRIYYVEATIGHSPEPSTSRLYAFDLAQATRTELTQLTFGTLSESMDWVNVSTHGTVLVYDLGKYDTISEEPLSPPAILELEHDRVVRRIPVVSHYDLEQRAADATAACAQLLDASPSHTPLGYYDIHTGLPSMRQKPIELAPRFVLVQTDAQEVALDVLHCGPELFARYVQNIDDGNIGTFNRSVMDPPRDGAWLYIEAADLSFTSRKTSRFGNFACENYEGELVWGDYKLKSERCVHGILKFPTSMNLFLPDNAIIYTRVDGVFKATKP